MENDFACAILEDKYTFKFKEKQKWQYNLYYTVHWTLFTNTCLAPPILRAIHA
jgi:hypothetical protein